MKVFLSSTALDLSEYRQVADDTILRLSQQTVAMERFGPLPGAPVEECERLARECDVVVCIVAHRYGFVPEKGKGSITRREVEAAKCAGKDVLVWIVGDDHPWTEKKEQDLLIDPNVLADPARVGEVADAVKGLIDFKAWLRTAFTPEAFTTPDDLGRKIAITLGAHIRGHSEPSLPQDKISIARLPTAGAELFGRESELKLLDDAWANPNTNIVSFVAWGGVGKTALVNHWLKRRMARDNFRGAERVYGWSFFSQGTTERAASADLFIDQALRWFNDPDPASGSPWDKGERLAGYIRKTRTLLILDGLEPLQHPPGSNEGRLKDAAMQALLVELGAQQSGLCVISTREQVGDLVEFEGATVSQHDLDKLSSQAGAQILRSLNVQGDDDEVEEASKELGGHAFSLTLLGSYLEEVLGGDIRRRKEIENLFADTRYGDAAQRMIAAYVKWLGEGMVVAILRLVGFFDRPADLPSIIALRESPAIAGLTESLQHFKPREWSQTIAKLRRVKLLGEASPSEPGTLDAHPLLRAYFKQELKGDRPQAWREGNERLYEYLKNRTKQFPDTIEEMAPLYAAVGHGCEAGKYEEAADIYWRRILRGENFYSSKDLGAHSSNLAALSAFFDTPWDQPVTQLADNSFVFNEVGFYLRALGRLQEAWAPLERAFRQAIGVENWRNAARCAHNLGELSLAIGDLVRAHEWAKQSVAFSNRSGNEFEKIASLTLLADSLHQAASIEEAASMFRDAEAIQKQRQPSLPLLYSVQGFRYCELLLSQGKIRDVTKRASQSLEWATHAKGVSPLDIALIKLTLGRAWLCDTEQAVKEGVGSPEELLQNAVTGLRHAGLLDQLPRGLLARAELWRNTHDFDRAQRDLAEVRRIATRSGMSLYLTDYHLESARLQLAQGDKEKAREHATTAKEMIEKMGYHRRDKEVDEIESQLA